MQDAPRDLILIELAQLGVDPADPDSLGTFVTRRALLLQQLDGLQDAWTPEQKRLLQEALAAGEAALQFAQARRQALARELTAFKAVRQAAKQQSTALPPRWRRTL